MEPANDFQRAAEDEADTGFFSELWGFLRHNKKWWLIPIVVILLFFGLVMFIATSSSAAPFIYTLF
jgi:Family of unknown function (DUF5989)